MERLTERNPLWIDDELWERACETGLRGNRCRISELKTTRMLRSREE